MMLLAADINPLAHVLDVNLIGGDGPLIKATEGWTVLGSPILTMHMVTLVFAAGLLIWLMMQVADAVGTGPESEGNERFITKGRFAQLIEVMTLYLRDNMLVPLLGKDAATKYLPFLMTVFFFILINNLIGLVPILDLQHIIGGLGWGDKYFAVIGGTATSNFAVTLALATIAFIVVNAHGIREIGLGGWLHHLLGGAPPWLAPIMVPVELMGLFIKPAALAVRLMANMVAGHTLMATLFLFGFMGYEAIGWIGAGAVSVVSIPFALAINFLEIFVGFLQAFIFMFLTAVFISQLSHHGHEHDESHDHPLDEHAAQASEAVHA